MHYKISRVQHVITYMHLFIVTESVIVLCLLILASSCRHHKHPLERHSVQSLGWSPVAMATGSTELLNIRLRANMLGHITALYTCSCDWGFDPKRQSSRPEPETGEKNRGERGGKGKDVSIEYLEIKGDRQCAADKIKHTHTHTHF